MANVPIYVKVEKFKDVVAVMQKIDNKLGTVEKMIDKINELKVQEDQQIKEWNDNIADIKDRVQGISDAFHQ